MRRITFAPEIKVSLIDAVSKIYWRKKHLKAFLVRIGIPKDLVFNRDWGDHTTKYESAESLLTDIESKTKEKKTEYVNALINAVVGFDDFTHLKLEDDAERKIAEAKIAVEALQKLLGRQTKRDNEVELRAEKRRAATEKIESNTEFEKRIDELFQCFLVISLKDPQARGYDLERFLYRLFSLFDLNPRDSFRVKEYQIDGAFTLGDTEFLLEARWRASEPARPDLVNFISKVNRSLENTLGLFVSIEGFDLAILEEFNHQTNVPIILLDGPDLMAVLQKRIRFDDLLRRKKQHAADRGEIFVRVQNII